MAVFVDREKIVEQRMILEAISDALGHSGMRVYSFDVQNVFVDSDVPLLIPKVRVVIEIEADYDVSKKFFEMVKMNNREESAKEFRLKAESNVYEAQTAVLNAKSELDKVRKDLEEAHKAVLNAQSELDKIRKDLAEAIQKETLLRARFESQ